MKKISKWVLRILAQNEISWFLLKPIVLFGSAISFTRRTLKYKVTDFSYLFQDLKVLNGPFKGMIYPSLNSVGSQIYPKLIGSYEQELHPTIDFFCKRAYSEIVDVGCAEGYYAVGLARIFEGAQVYAYDIDETARLLCEKMATLNKVQDRIHVREFCSAEELKSFSVSSKALLICDCEGFEKQLFTAFNLDNLRNFDLLIEVHDFVDITISDYLHSLLSDTHAIHIVRSIDDIEKARTYTFLKESLSLSEKKKLYEESRPGIMEWMVCISKQDTKQNL